MTDLIERSARSMARAVRAREVSALELFEAHAARIAERDAAINALASALGLPAVCVPVMRAGGSGLPVGVQLIGARGSERSLLALAAELESALGGWLAPA